MANFDISQIEEVATVTSKGQLTLPISIRKAAAITAGTKLHCRLVGREIHLVIGNDDHEDPALEAFLSLLETDIRYAGNLSSLPTELEERMIRLANDTVNLEAEIVGEVEL